ncbi:MAG: NADH-quinone oxidoreductase subunit J [Proteobacteria bacterium]|nr:NADH-quinone oxidoreductase subunit J [Pseudomonadota bacterium]
MLSVLGAIGLVLFRHPMNGAMSLVVTMISLAGLYALLSAKLIFALQLIVYAGAIMSLVLFIIMFLNIQDSDLPTEKGRWLYQLGGIIVILPIASFLIKIVKSIPGSEATIVGSGFGGVKEVGLVLFQDWLLPFEIVSILLLVALVGAVVLAGKRRMGK